VAPVDFQAAYGKGAALGVERRPFQDLPGGGGVGGDDVGEALSGSHGAR